MCSWGIIFQTTGTSFRWAYDFCRCCRIYQTYYHQITFWRKICARWHVDTWGHALSRWKSELDGLSNWTELLLLCDERFVSMEIEYIFCTKFCPFSFNAVWYVELPYLRKQCFVFRGCTRIRYDNSIKELILRWNLLQSIAVLIFFSNRSRQHLNILTWLRITFMFISSKRAASRSSVIRKLSDLKN